MPEQYLVQNQTHPEPLSPYEQKLSGALMEIFGTGVHDLDGLLAGLNAMGLNAPEGDAWNEANFRAEMRRLGD
ncbi:MULTISPECIES: recombinase-like helix-turn-helix domain-containing protein [unclassified Nocardioides]|uniref:recombinase-like helix-turn-helix domain-containing protein n=1 Tax=unclassified Nocardioides TaxID=2615069 RepID=UPI000700737B|nr:MULTISPECIES: recombinase-like helix-turn-helix domain-containing protein [unclassified Nocardioides]KQY50901.1 hypothetical protein ASD30_20665 [Nocardioides sp. Root140]KQZ75608.1 hypothetical protein ASD66_04490 [Nocardioides sp. Root151]KRF14676.1 hypothetical protein ASH02_10245 [Nocardioides sp. Soil796]